MQRLPNPEFNPLKTQPRPLRQNQHPQRVKTWTPTQPPSAHARCPPSPSHTTPDPTCTRSLSPPTPTHLSACIPTPRMMCTMTFRTRPSECWSASCQTQCKLVSTLSWQSASFLLGYCCNNSLWQTEKITGWVTDNVSFFKTFRGTAKNYASRLSTTTSPG